MSSPKTSPPLGGTATARQPRPTLSAAELAALARVAAAAPSSPASRSGHLEKLSSGAAAALKDDGASTANNDATASRERLRSSMGTVFGRRWKRRFFVLHDGFLYWFAGETVGRGRRLLQWQCHSHDMQLASYCRLELSPRIVASY